jgi:hypothetical protein
MVQTSGSLTLRINNGDTQEYKDIVLPGQIGEQIQVGFRATDGKGEVKIGTFESVIASVAKALGVGQDFAEKFRDLIKKLGEISEDLAAIATKLLEAQLFITDMALNASYVKNEATGKKEFKVSSAAFGFRVEFDELKIGPVQLVGFGVLFEYTVDENGKGGDGRLTTIPV